jgi:hypothetical protein
MTRNDRTIHLQELPDKHLRYFLTAIANSENIPGPRVDHPPQISRVIRLLYLGQMDLGKTKIGMSQSYADWTFDDVDRIYYDGIKSDNWRI